MKNIAFIINPISGTKNKNRIPKLIERTLDHSQWAYDIVKTEYKGHATELASQYAKLGFDAVVAVGGDGTVNEVASGLIHTDTALGILPIGSGNGFARHLNLPLQIEKAIKLINSSEPITVDYGIVNSHPFFCTCGTGFDAYIADKFAKAGKRGFATYLQHIIKDFFNYQSQHYKLQFREDDSQEWKYFETDAFLITFANANQWGNSAYIAPKASIQDGLLDISVLSAFPMTAIPSLAYKLFEKTIDQTTYITTLHATQVILTRQQDGPFHYDGDPIDEHTTIDIQIKKDGLKVLVAKRF